MYIIYLHFIKILTSVNRHYRFSIYIDLQYFYDGWFLVILTILEGYPVANHKFVCVHICTCILELYLLLFFFLAINTIVTNNNFANQSTLKNCKDDEQQPKPMPEVAKEKFT